MKEINIKKTLEIVSRYYVFFFLNFYGIGKIMGGQFYRRGRLPLEIAQTTIGEASAYDLAWSFMGYSFYYILFIGVSQIIGAWLLLWNRTKLFGVIILFPIMINIVVFDIIFLDVKDALVNAIIYTLMLIYILYYNRPKVANAFHALTRDRMRAKFSKVDKLKRLAVIAVVWLTIFGVDQLLVNFIRNR